MMTLLPPPNPRMSRAESGFSLIETILVVSVTLILVALTGKFMFSALDSYNISASARQLGATVQLAREKATGRSTRYRVSINPAAGTFRVEACTSEDLSTNPPSCTGWALPAGSVDTQLSRGVQFSTSGIATAAPGDTTGPKQATAMTFNSRGLLIDSTNNPASNACFYLQRPSTRPTAVCTTMVGRTTVYRLAGSTWQTQ